jgi:hypothetical protein
VHKRRITDAEKWAIIGERMAKEGPRRLDHMVIVSVEDETDDNGEPIVTVLRMRGSAKKKKTTRKRKI